MARRRAGDALGAVHARWCVVAALLGIVVVVGGGACAGEGGGGSKGSATGPRADWSFTQVLAGWDEAAGTVTDQLDSIGQDVVALDAALKADDEPSVDLSIDQLANDVTLLLGAAQELDVLEDEIRIRQGATGDRVEVSQKPLIGLIAFGATIYGIYRFGRAMGGYGDDLSDARQRRDVALQGITEQREGAEEEYRRARDDMEAARDGALTEFTTKVSTDLVLAPVAPTSVVRVVLKDQAGNRTQEGLKVLAGSEGCEDGADGDCRVSAGRTDAQGKVTVPAGTVSVAVSGGGNARVVRRAVEAPAGGEGQVEVAAVPIGSATPAQVAAADAGEDPGPGPGPDAVSGGWPAEPLGGLTVTYTIEGLSLGAPDTSVDWQGYWSHLVYPIEAVQGAVRIRGVCAFSGAASASGMTQGSALIQYGATVEQVADSFEGAPTNGSWSWSFDVTAPVAAGETYAYVAITCAHDPAPGEQYLIQVRASSPD